ncbi:glycoside hydrolase family 13 protein [Halobacillus sp. KGW1]|uniref:glycoside hydrolase family 13 protein n=1 Tax=Halobacillus sp. KGW1 TaxID=1793726 RepID=UPI000784D83F|nr:glycoside hydrolase family 13 protein [Halobacillus sp. KGW1]
MKKWSLISFVGIALLFLLFAQPFAQKADAAETTYDKVVLRGSAESLDWGSDNHPLAYDAEKQLWESAPVELKGGKTVEYKFVYDGKWMEGSNLTFTPSQDGKYIFTFHPDKERTVDIRLADTHSGSVTLNLSVPEETPDWAIPTVASSKNGFNYTVSPMEKTGDGIYTLRVVGDASEELTYFYSLSGEAYKEDRTDPRTVTLREDGDNVYDKVDKWLTIPVAQSVRHDFNHAPYTPNKKDVVQVEVEVQHFGPIDAGAVYYTTDGSIPDGKRGTAVQGRTSFLTVQETSTAPDGLQTSILEGTIPAQKNKTRVKYKIDVWNKSSEGSQFADNNALTSEEATEFAYYVDDYKSPKWAKEAVIYQVFVDRFRDGDVTNNTSVQPDLPKDEQLKGWMGGDLQGVIDKLDYIEELGVNTLWISPIYEGPYSHGYHPTDFMKVDPRFGSNKLMKELVKKAHKRDMKVIYDLVPNHTSNQHDFFQDALSQGTGSKYYDWYTFTKWPDEYDTFYSVKELPELNNDNPDTRDYMLNEVVPFWMEDIGVDGFRLDYAKGPSQSFWVDFRHKVKSIDSNAFIFGEVWDDLDTITSYTGKLDGAIDFETQTALHGAFIQGKSMNELAASLETIQNGYAEEFVAATFLDSHDMPRFFYEAKENETTMKNAATLQFLLPGAPIIYYGDEVGLSQSGDHNAVEEWKDRYYREFMPWNKQEQNREIKNHYKKLIDIRTKEQALTHGDFRIVYSDEDVLVFERKTRKNHVLVVVNQGTENRRLDAFELYNQRTPNRVQLQSLLDKDKYKSHKGKLMIESEAKTVSAYEVKGKLR